MTKVQCRTTNPCVASIPYFGFIDEIWELNYVKFSYPYSLVNNLKGKKLAMNVVNLHPLFMLKWKQGDLIYLVGDRMGCACQVYDM